MSPLKQKHEEYHNHEFPNEANHAKIWINHRLHEYVAKRAFGIDVEGLSKKIITTPIEEGKTQVDMFFSTLKESHLEAKNFGRIPFEKLCAIVSEAEYSTEEINAGVEMVYDQILDEILDIKCHCELPGGYNIVPAEFKIPSNAPEKITLAEIVGGRAGQGTRSSFRAFLQLSLAVVGARTNFKMIINEADACTGVFSGESNDAHKLVIHLLLWLTEATKSETDIEGTVGGALREFFTDDLWVTLNTGDWLFPPAIGMGSIVPTFEYTTSIKGSNIPFFIFGCPLRDTSFTAYDDLDDDPDSEPPTREYETQDHSQVAITTLPTLFLLVLAVTTLREGQLVVKPSKDDFILAIVYTHDYIEIEALVPIWQGARKGWRFARCTVFTFWLRLLQDTRDWMTSSWHQCMRLAVALKIVKEHNERLAARLNASQFDDVVTDALRVWQDNGEQSKEAENYIRRLRDAGGEELEAYLHMERRLLDPQKDGGIS